MEFPVSLAYLAIVVLSFLVISPKIHTGLLGTIGMSAMGLGFLGLALQNNELGSLQYGVSGQWTAIKIGAFITVVGLLLNLLKPRKSTKSNCREISSKEQRQVSGGNSEPTHDA